MKVKILLDYFHLCYHHQKRYSVFTLRIFFLYINLYTCKISVSIMKISMVWLYTAKKWSTKSMRKITMNDRKIKVYMRSSWLGNNYLKKKFTYNYRQIFAYEKVIIKMLYIGAFCSRIDLKRILGAVLPALINVFFFNLHGIRKFFIYLFIALIELQEQNHTVKTVII